MHHKSLLKIIIRRNDVRTFQPFNKQIEEPGPYKRCFGVWTILFSIVFLCLAVSFDSFRGCKNPQHKMESFLMFLRFINTYLELFRGTISAKLVDFLGCICRGKCLPLSIFVAEKRDVWGGNKKQLESLGFSDELRRPLWEKHLRIFPGRTPPK